MNSNPLDLESWPMRLVDSDRFENAILDGVHHKNHG